LRFFQPVKSAEKGILSIRIISFLRIREKCMGGKDKEGMENKV
jgi:hypothetical protein